MPPPFSETSDNATAVKFSPEQFVKEHHNWMLALATSLVKEKGAAEDVVQEALIKALSNYQTFEHRSKVKTWLHRITVNQAINKLKKTKRLAEDSFDDQQPEFDAKGCRIEPKWGPLASPETLLSQKQNHQKIEQAFSAIPESHALIVKLRDIEGYDTKEVAKLLEISESNVKVRLHRARAALKKILEPMLNDDEVK